MDVFFWNFSWVYKLIIKSQKLDLFTWINIAHRNIENHIKIYNTTYLRKDILGVLISSLYATSPLPLNFWPDQCNRVFLATLNSQMTTPQLPARQPCWDAMQRRATKMMSYPCIAWNLSCIKMWFFIFLLWRWCNNLVLCGIPNPSLYVVLGGIGQKVLL